MAKAKPPKKQTKPPKEKEAKPKDKAIDKPTNIKKSATSLLQQSHLPGMAPETNPRVHAAALVYAKARDKRMAAGIEEKDAELNLLYVMNEEKVKAYEFNGVIVNLMNKVKPKVEVQAEKKKSKPKKEKKAKDDDAE